MANFSFQDKTVVILIKDAILGGAERQALGFAKYIKENFKCSVYIVVTYSNNQSFEFKDFLKEIGIEKVYHFGPPSLSLKNEISIKNFKKATRALKYLLRMTLKIRKFKPDILVPFMNGPSKIASLIYKYTGAKITFWHQLGLEVCFYDYLEKIAVKKTPLIIANAENGLDVFKNYYKIENERLFVLPQYVVIEKVMLDKEKIREKFTIPSNAIVIGMISHYREEKFQELLIEAFSVINSKVNIHLVLLGNKDNNESAFKKFDLLKKLINKLNLTDKVSLLSGVPVQEVLNILDIGVLVSEIEGTPNVLMEYMTYGLPVVVTNHKGCNFLLGDSEFLIPNIKLILVDKLEKLVENDLLREKEGHNNLEKIKGYTPKIYFERLETLLKKTI